MNKIYTAEELKALEETLKANTSKKDQLKGQYKGLMEAMSKEHNLGSEEALDTALEESELMVKDKEAKFAEACATHQALLDA
jgi:hypothetical protein